MWITLCITAFSREIRIFYVDNFEEVCGFNPVENVDKEETEHNFCENCCVYHKRKYYVIRQNRISGKMNFLLRTGELVE